MTPIRRQQTSPRDDERRAGFTMVEVIVALLILTVGVLGLAGTTGLIVSQVTMSKVRTERANAQQTVLETLRATDYDALSAGNDSIGNYAVSWTVSGTGTSKLITVVTQGPGMRSSVGSLASVGPSVVDTLTYRRIRP